MNTNSCDFGHETTGEVRLLPVGGDGNVILCREHYRHEIRYRRSMIALGKWTKENTDLPKWESLKVYEGA